MISLANTLAAIGLFSPIAITLYLDKNAKDSHKKLLNTVIINSTETTLIKYIHTIEKYWSHRISKPKKFVLDMSIISFIAIIFVMSFQFYISPTDFQQDSKVFIEQIIEFDLFAILALASLIFVDIISFYQTTVFFRFARHCKNLFEITFIGIADVLMSFFLAVFILPILIATAFNVSRVSTENSFYLGMSVEPAQANLDFYEAIYFAAPSLWDKTETDPKVSEENEIFLRRCKDWVGLQLKQEFPYKMDSPTMEFQMCRRAYDTRQRLPFGLNTT